MNRSDFIKLMSVLGIGSLMPSQLTALATEHPELAASMFGPDFIWGTATSSYQIEGAWNIDGKGESIWDRFTHNTKKIHNRDTGDIACDFYNRYPSDIELMRQLNFQASRFSISWPRIMPEGKGAVNQKGLDFYDRVIDKCLETGVDPWVTCYHWDLPQMLQDKGGWENRDIVGWFQDYVALCGKTFGDRVKNWMVFNEPASFIALGYLIGVHAPGKFGFGHFLPALHHSNLAHGAGGRALRDTVWDANIGTCYSCSPIQPLKDKERHHEVVKRADAMFNRVYIEPVLGMGYPIEDLPKLRKIEKYIQPEDERNMPFDFDFIGVQYYFRTVMKPFFAVPAIHGINVKPKKLTDDLSDMGWEIYPEGLYDIIKQFAKYKQIKKFYITENGTAFPDTLLNGEVNDEKRVKFYQDHLKQVLKAKNEGVNIGGYFAWSFLDNFEWAEGYKPRFGLVHVDYETQQRTVKASGKWFADFISK
jgi:beta-glucosidase